MNMNQYMIQAAAADIEAANWIRQLEEQGYVEGVPGVWEKKDEEGNVVAVASL